MGNLRREFSWREIEAVGSWVARGPSYLRYQVGDKETEHHVAKPLLSCFHEDNDDFIGFGIYRTDHNYDLLRRFTWRRRSDMESFRERNDYCGRAHFEVPMAVSTDYAQASFSLSGGGDAILSAIVGYLLHREANTGKSYSMGSLDPEHREPELGKRVWYSVRFGAGYLEQRIFESVRDETFAVWLSQFDCLWSIASKRNANPELMTECYRCDPFADIARYSVADLSLMPDSIFADDY